MGLRSQDTQEYPCWTDGSLGDGFCNEDCNIAECRYDAGDCQTPPDPDIDPDTDTDMDTDDASTDSEATGSVGSCYEFSDDAGSQIQGCDCYETCGDCGYSDSPTDPTDCINCADGSDVVPIYEDGTGCCGQGCYASGLLEGDTCSSTDVCSLMLDLFCKPDENLVASHCTQCPESCEETYPPDTHFAAYSTCSYVCAVYNLMEQEAQAAALGESCDVTVPCGEGLFCNLLNDSVCQACSDVNDCLNNEIGDEGVANCEYMCSLWENPVYSSE